MYAKLNDMGIDSVKSAQILANITSGEKNKILFDIADELEKSERLILDSNKLDMDRSAENGISKAMSDRLLLTPQRISDIAQSVRDVAKLPDPVGKILSGTTLENGLEMIKKTVPLGTIAIIYESRPNVTVDCGVLCLKSGNACILRGGSEAINSNKALIRVIQKAIEKNGLPPKLVQLVEDTSRETATELMRLNKYIDLLIPRGGKGLIKSVVENSTVPVIETGAGNCHIFVDESADIPSSLKIVDNAKTSRPSVCNAVETLLVHKNIAADFLPQIAKVLGKNNVEIHGCKRTQEIIGDKAIPATESDWETEYDDYILAVKVVDSIEESVMHIEKYSTHHSESILTQNYSNSQYFVNHVNSAAVYINASTRFTDGGVFGLGAEIGISTQKLHARGPMGLDALTSTKYIIRGDGQIR